MIENKPAMEVSDSEIDSSAMDIVLTEIMQSADTLWRNGESAQAIDTYKALLAEMPSYSDASYKLACIYLDAQDLVNAASFFEQAIQSKPTAAMYWDQYLHVLRMSGDEQVLQEAAFLRDQFLNSQESLVEPEVSHEHVDLTLSTEKIDSTQKEIMSPQVAVSKTVSSSEKYLSGLYHKGKFVEILKYTEKATKKNSGDSLAWRYSGLAFIGLQKLDDAETHMLKAVELAPSDAIAQFNLALIFVAKKKYPAAELSYKSALATNPEMLEACNNLGNLLRALKKLDEAEFYFRKAIEIDRNFAVGYLNLAALLREKRRLSEAKYFAEEAVRLAPNLADSHNALGAILQLLGDSKSSLIHLERAIALRPDYVEALFNIGNIFFDQNEILLAQKYYERCIKIDPSLASAYRSLGNILHTLGGRQDQVESLYRKALSLDPSDSTAFSSLLFFLVESFKASPALVFEEHKNFSVRYEMPFIPFWPKHTNNKNHDRPLRVGFVSGDFFNHAVSSYIGSILKELSTKTQLNLFAYYNRDLEDEVTHQLKSNFVSWKSVHNYSDLELAQVIETDQIDILCDLSGHTTNNRLLTFARKPAPVQFSWIGYPGTSGLRAMDYYVTDRYLVPAGDAEKQFSEKIVRLPVCTPFEPYKNSPEISPLPALKNKSLQFGSFNRISKISDSVIYIWSEILNALPDSHMIIGGLPKNHHPDEMIAKFAAKGVVKERLTFLHRSNMEGFLKQLQTVDLCLDTFPYTGATTSMHGLWMGVPTLTLAGNSSFSREGQAILQHLQLEQFVATDNDDLVHKAVFWSSNRNDLASIRSGLRQRVLQSDYLNPNKIAVAFEKALRVMWYQWCDGQPITSFNVDD